MDKHGDKNFILTQTSLLSSSISICKEISWKIHLHEKLKEEEAE